MSENTKRSYIPHLEIPEPSLRPGDNPDFSHIEVPEVEALNRPDPLCHFSETKDHSKGIIRTMNFDGTAAGEWQSDITTQQKLSGLKTMLLARAMDDRMFKMQRQNKMSFYMKCLGEEAITSAQALAARTSDMIFPTYRCLPALLQRGQDMKTLMCQCLSNSGDTMTKGRQMPVFYSTKEYGFFTISGNLGTQTIQAVGWAMANSYKGSDDIAIAYTGEGATAESDFYHTLNFASTYRTPTIINVVNNQWAISTFQGMASGQSFTFASRARGHGLAALRVDGNDFLAVYAVTQWAAERARNGGGATVIEHFTHRGEGHSSSDDTSAYRPDDEKEAWPFGDCIDRLKVHLIAIGDWDEKRHEKLIQETFEEVKQSYAEAEALGYATQGGTGGISPESMFDDVFEHVPQHLVKQRQKMGY